MKKGQLFGQPFTFIFALVVAALILVFGFNLVYKFMNTAESVEVERFVNSLRDTVEQYYYLDEGSSTKVRIQLPSKVNYLCVFNASNSWNPSTNDISSSEKFIMQSNRNRNVFLLPSKSYKTTTFYVNYLESYNRNPKCFGNNKEITLTSKGFYVEAS